MKYKNIIPSPEAAEARRTWGKSSSWKLSGSRSLGLGSFKCFPQGNLPNKYCTNNQSSTTRNQHV